jgi:hypothetical protein
MADKRLFVNSVLIHSTHYSNFSGTLLCLKFRERIVLTGHFQSLNKSKGNYQKPINPGHGKFEITRHAVDIQI